MAVTRGAESVIQAAATELRGLQLHLCVLLLAARQAKHQTVRYIMQHDRLVLRKRKENIEYSEYIF